MAQQLSAIALVERLADREAKVDALEEVKLETVHLLGCDATDLGHVGVGVEVIVVELDGQQDAGQQNTMNTQRGDGNAAALHSEIDVDQTGNQELVTAFKVANDSREQERQPTSDK
jgi:hypothetical protein